MGFVEILTIVLVVLKATGHLHVPWVVAFLPEIIMVVIYILAWVLTALFGVRLWRKHSKKIHNDFNDRFPF